MKRELNCAALGFGLAIACALVANSQEPARQKAPRQQAGYPFAFRDVGDEAGAFPHVAGVRGHAAAWGDVDGNGWADLFVGTFHNSGSKPSMLLLNTEGKFKLDGQSSVQTSGQGSGALFLDLTNTGKLDLYVSNCAHGKETAPNVLLRNDGTGKFTDVSAASGACPPDFAGRGVAAIDFDADGLLDLLTCERYYGAVKHGPALFRNLGKHQFENASATAGLPPKLSGLGVVAADVNGDTWPDIFLTSGIGEHRLLLNDGKGKFREAPGTADVFRWEGASEDNNPAGVCIADVNRDGLPDVVIGNHYKAPWVEAAPIRLYLHRGVKNGVPQFEDISQAAGIEALEMKAPHVEIQDFDNDGWPDIYFSIVKFKGKEPCPVIFRNAGVKDGLPRFVESAWSVNDYPTAEDKAIKRSGTQFDKILAEKKIIYMAPGPSADFNRDGKLDLFLVNWWNEDRSLLLSNETQGGNYLQVQLQCDGGVNRMGIGSQISVYPAGKLGDASALLGKREIAIGYGYCSGQEAFAHFGLGDQKAVDIQVILPHGKGRYEQKNVPANQRLTMMPR